MKKKLSILLCAFVALFFGSCTDLSVNDEAALKADLPSDFDWKIYAEINQDVASSQIIFNVREKNKGFGDSISNCLNLLKDEELAENIYLKYAACPKDGWDKDKKCPGIYAYNTSYNKPTNSDSTSWECSFGSKNPCWQDSWESLKESLNDTLTKYIEAKKTDGPVNTMCKFIPEATEASKVLDYLNNFPLDSLLIIDDYRYLGFYDGRPYKYCKGQHGNEKTLALADKRGTYYDYSKYTFCLEENEQKIYVAK